MFEKLPHRYDGINRLFTFGLDERWRKKAVKRCIESQPKRILDLGCGTGDMLVHLARMSHEDTEIIGADFAQSMLDTASVKVSRRGLGDRVHFVQADARKLPWPDAYFDAITVSFAFRNMTFKNPAREEHLAEMKRVLAPKGRLVIVESSQPRSKTFRALVHFYVRSFVGPIGAWLSGQKAAYRYLSSSAANYYTAEQVTNLLQDAGFELVTHLPLLGGTAAIHVAQVSEAKD